MDPDALAKAFADHYYFTFDSNRAGLGSLCQDGSMLTFEGQKTQGAQNIVNKLASLLLQQCQHHNSTVDCQPSGPAGGMLVFDSGTHALKFSQGRERAVDPDDVVKDFLKHYYSNFYLDRDGLKVLYRDGSMLTFEGQNTQGAQNIIDKLKLLPFSQHEISTINCQPSGPAGGMLVMVSGTIHHNEQRALKFSQTFHLMPAGGSFYGFYVLNDIFLWN